MASGLYIFQSGVTRKLLPCFKHSIFKSTYLETECQSIVTIALNPGFTTDDDFQVRGKQQHVEKKLLSLKEKEKGDWRSLSLAEKQELYRMSFSQPFSEAVEQPKDEWKIILAGAFTAMGLMTLGIYTWMSHSNITEHFNGPILFQNDLIDEKNVDLFFHTNIAASDKVE